MFSWLKGVRVYRTKLVRVKVVSLAVFAPSGR